MINRVLGKGVDDVGRKLARAADRALPDPAREAIDALKLGVTPMGAGSERAQAEAKDFANALRVADYQHARLDKWLNQHFTPDQQKTMWEAADEHGVLLRRGVEPGPGQGMNRLNPDERAAVENLQARANQAFKEASALGMVKGDGLESYVPRMVVKLSAFGNREPLTVGRAGKQGTNLSSTTGQLRQRKYETTEETQAAAQAHFGDKAIVVRSIRTLPLATARLDRAIAGRRLIDKIKEASKGAGTPLVVEGANSGSGQLLHHGSSGHADLGPEVRHRRSGQNRAGRRPERRRSVRGQAAVGVQGVRGPAQGRALDADQRRGARAARAQVQDDGRDHVLAPDAQRGDLGQSHSRRPQGRADVRGLPRRLPRQERPGDHAGGAAGGPRADHAPLRQDRHGLNRLRP